MTNFEKLCKRVIKELDENFAGDGGAFGDTSTASPPSGDYEVEYAGGKEGDNRNLFGEPPKKKKRKMAKKSKFPWLQRRNLHWSA